MARPGSSIPLLALAALAILAVVAVRVLRTDSSVPLEAEKREAARLMAEGEKLIAAAKAERGVAIERADDPNGTGLIGARYTPITTTLGPLEVKRTSTNPAFAAVVVELLREAGVRRGDLVAAGFSGSFPALNLAVLSAAKAMGVTLEVISSATASTYGATDPAMTWLDMEAELARMGLFETRSIAASPGGYESSLTDTFFPGSRDLATQAITRNGIPLLAAEGMSAAVAERMAAYLANARGRPIRAFVNVGGASYNLGSSEDMFKLRSGVVRDLPAVPDDTKGVISRMADRGLPVVSLLNVREMALRYGLPLDPVPLPAPGEGEPFRQRPSPLVPLAALACLLAAFVGAALWQRRGGATQERSPR